MMQSYSYIVTVIDGRGKTFKVAGTVEAEKGDLKTAIADAVRESFEKLTRGDTMYGHPGIGQCRGPYTIDAFELNRIP